MSHAFEGASRRPGTVGEAAGQQLRELPSQILAKARNAETALEQSAPVNWVHQLLDAASDLFTAAVNYSMYWLQSHPHISTFSRLCLLFGAIPTLVWIGANLGVIAATLVIAGLVLAGINGTIILATTSVLGFTLLFTTAAAGFTYLLVFSYGVTANLTRRTYRYLSGTLDEVVGRQK